LYNALRFLGSRGKNDHLLRQAQDRRSKTQQRIETKKTVPQTEMIGWWVETEEGAGAMPVHLSSKDFLATVYLHRTKGQGKRNATFAMPFYSY
jgi:hypothetical protein